MAGNIEQRQTIPQVVREIEYCYKSKVVTQQDVAALEDESAYLGVIRDIKLQSEYTSENEKNATITFLNISFGLGEGKYGLGGQKILEADSYAQKLVEVYKAEGLSDAEIADNVATQFNGIKERVLSTEIPPYK